MRTAIRTGTAAAGAALALALAPAGADAAALPKSAKFLVDLRADQVETWSFDKPDDPADACDAPSRGGGSQRVTIRRRGLRVNVISSREIDGGKPLVAGERGPLPVALTVNREGTYGVDYGRGGGPECDTGIYGDNEPPPTPDCGRRTGAGTLDLPFTARHQLEVGVEPRELLQPFLQCPFWVGGHEPDGAGGLSPRRFRLPERQLFDARRKRIVLHGGTEKCFDESGFTICGEEQGPMRGRIVTTFALTLRRR